MLYLQTVSVPTCLLELAHHAALCVSLEMKDMIYFSFSMAPNPEPATTSGVNQRNWSDQVTERKPAMLDSLRGSRLFSSMVPSRAIFTDFKTYYPIRQDFSISICMGKKVCLHILWYIYIVYRICCIYYIIDKKNILWRNYLYDFLVNNDELYTRWDIPHPICYKFRHQSKTSLKLINIVVLENKKERAL